MPQKQWRTLPTRYATTVGDGAATSFTVTHNLGHQDVQVAVRAAGGTFAYLPMGAGAGGWTVTAATNNTVVVTFGTAPTANQYRIIVIG